jgi:hypothetical protein
MLLDDLQDYTQAGGFGVRGGLAAPNGTIWGGFFPDSPDDLIVFEEYGGREADYVQESPLPDVEYPRVQVRVRNTQYDTGRLIAEQLYRYLGAVKNRQINGTWYQRLLPLQSPYRLDRDVNNRHHLAFNVEVRKGLSA